VLVNLSLVTALLPTRVGVSASIAAGIAASICSNFYFNRRFTFSHSTSGHMPTQFLSYLLSVSFGALVNYAVALALLHFFKGLAPQLAALGGIVAATIVNFLALKYIVFKRRHYRPR
jgi:putative flippase GtrA